MASKISGIYAYYDNSRCEIVYVGRDSHIDENRRDRDHYAPSNRDEQQINRVLQNDNNSGRYSYVILEKGCFTNDELNQKEIYWIKYFDPRFNFTPGGDGVGSGENHPRYGKKHSEESRKKISRAMSGKNNPMYGKTGKNNPFYGKNNPFYGKKHTKQARKKMSEARKGTKNAFNPCIKIRKSKSNTCKQGFRWNTQVSTPEKKIFISSVDLEKCIEKVEDFLESEENVYGYDSYEVVNE